MKRLALFLSGLSLCLAQTVTQNSTTTAIGVQADIANVSNNPAIAWRLAVWATGSITAFTAQLDCAPDNGAGGPGTYAACTGAFDGTTNPVTAAATPFAATITVKLATPHIAFHPTSITGSGTLHWNLTGLFGANTAPSTVTSSGGGGGGGGPVTTACTAQAEVSLSGTGYTTIVAGSGSTVISLCNVAMASASAGTPIVNTFTFAFGTCAGSPTEILSLPGVTGYTDQFLGSLAGTAGQAFCVKEAVANSDKVTVSYLQH